MILPKSITKFSALFIIVSLAISACGEKKPVKETEQVDKIVTTTVQANTQAAIVAPNNDLKEIVLPDFLAGTNLKAGKREFAKCRACHTLEQGQRNKVGPNLFSMFGNNAGFNSEFSYSKALQNSDIVWDMKSLDKWLENPREFISGTSMAFVGVRNEQKRRALMAYLYVETANEDQENNDNGGDEQ